VSEELASTTAPLVSKRDTAEPWLQNLLLHMDYPATLDFKDLDDGSLGIAVHFQKELPGITPGKRTWLVDCMQFLLNKVVNPPTVPRRWVNLGVNDFPVPRAAKPVREAAATGSKPESQTNSPTTERKEERGRNEKKTPRARDEKMLVAAEVAPEKERVRDPRPEKPKEKPGAVKALPEWTILGQTLAEKSAKFGRYYGVMLLSADNRQRLVKASSETKGCAVKSEGEGCWTRVVYHPEKPVIIAKRQVMPDYGDGADEEE
jgi:hypothetical protein